MLALSCGQSVRKPPMPISPKPKASFPSGLRHIQPNPGWMTVSREDSACPVGPPERVVSICAESLRNSVLNVSWLPVTPASSAGLNARAASESSTRAVPAPPIALFTGPTPWSRCPCA